MKELELVPFDQFEKRLADHRKQVEKMHKKSLREEEALRAARAVFPVATHNKDGSLRYYLTPAMEQLREDVEFDFHQHMTPTDMRNSREIYQQTFPTVEAFKKRLYQEIRYRKMVNWKSDKREVLLSREAVKYGKTQVEKKSEADKKATKKRKTTN